MELNNIKVDNEYLKKFKLSKPPSGESRHFRDKAISAFVEKINIERLGTDFKPVTPAAVAARIARSLYPKKATGEEIWRLFRYFEEMEVDCRRDNKPITFSMLFWSRTDPKKAK